MLFIIFKLNYIVFKNNFSKNFTFLKHFLYGTVSPYIYMPTKSNNTKDRLHYDLWVTSTIHLYIILRRLIMTHISEDLLDNDRPIT